MKKVYYINKNGYLRTENMIKKSNHFIWIDYGDGIIIKRGLKGYYFSKKVVISEIKKPYINKINELNEQMNKKLSNLNLQK